MCEIFMKFFNKYFVSLIVFLILAIFLYFSFISFFINLKNVESFCNTIQESPNLPLEQVAKQALKEKLSVIENKKENRITIYDKKTRGKVTCTVTNNGGKIDVIYIGE